MKEDYIKEDLIMKKHLPLMILFLLASDFVLAINCSETPESNLIYERYDVVCEFFKEKTVGNKIMPEKLFCSVVEKAKICNEEAVKPCNFQFNHTRYSQLKIDECFIIHNGEKIECGEPLKSTKTTEGWTDLMTLSLTLPSCSDGDIYSMKYNRTYTSLMHRNFYYTFYFGGFNYEEHSRFEFIIPDGVEFYYGSSWDTQPKILKKEGKRHYIWEKQDTKPISDEEYMPPMDKILDVMRVSSYKDYGDIYSESKYIFKNINTGKTIQYKAYEIVGDAEGEEAVKLIYDWVRKNIRYISDKLVVGGSEISPKPETVLSNGYGDCEDFAILLVSLLKAKGFNAEPVLYGSGHEFPQTSNFNHAIVKLTLGNKTIWMDATCRTCPYDTIPYSEYNKYVLPMSDKNIERTPIYNSVDYETLTNVYYRIKDSVVEVNYSREILDLVSAEDYRYYFEYLNEKELLGYFQDLALDICMDYGGLKYSLKNTGDSYKNLTISMQLKCNGLIGSGGESISANILKAPLLPDYLKSSNRIHDLDFGKSSLTRRNMVIEFPQGYAVKTKLEEINIDDHYYKHHLNYSNVGNKAFIQEEKYMYRHIPKDRFQILKDSYLQYNRIIKSIKAEKTVSTTVATTTSTLEEVIETTTQPERQENQQFNPLFIVIGVISVVLIIITIFKAR